MPRLRFESFGADQVVADQDRINRAQRESIENVEKQKRASMDFDRTARAIARRNESEQERYNRLLGEADKAFKANRISADQYQREVASINREMEKGEGRFRTYQTQQDKTFGADAILRIGKYAAGMVSVHQALSLVTRELQAQQGLRDAASETRATVFTSRQDVRRNMAGVSLGEQDRILAQNEALATQLGISVVTINQARAQALSASGGDVEGSLRAVRGAALFLGDRPEEIAGFAGSLVDIGNVTGTKNEDVNLGLLTTFAALNRSVNPRAIAQNAPRSLIGQIGFGSTPQGAVALLATLSRVAGDQQLGFTGTGSIALAEQLREFRVDPKDQFQGLERFQGRLERERAKRIPDTGEIKKLESQVAAFKQGITQITTINEQLSGLGTTTERIRFLQSRPELAQRFLADASFEKAVKAPVEQLVTSSSSAVARMYEESLASIPGFDGLASRAGRTLADLQSGRLADMNLRARSLSTFRESEEMRLAGRGFLGADERQDLEKILGLVGGSALLGQFQSRFGDLAGGIDTNEAIGFLRNQQARLRSPTAISAGTGAAPTIVEASAEDKLAASRLEALVQRLVELQERQNARDPKAEMRGVGL